MFTVRISPAFLSGKEHIPVSSLTPSDPPKRDGDCESGAFFDYSKLYNFTYLLSRNPLALSIPEALSYFPGGPSYPPEGPVSIPPEFR